MKTIMPQEVIENKIFLIRGHKVMIDKDLSYLYGVSTKRLNEQVRRNMKRFPEDFMFQATEEEAVMLEKLKPRLRSQFATSNRGGTLLSGAILKGDTLKGKLN